MVVNQLKVHSCQSSGFRWVNLHPYSAGGIPYAMLFGLDEHATTMGEYLYTMDEVGAEVQAEIKKKKGYITVCFASQLEEPFVVYELAPGTLRRGPQQHATP